MKRLIQTLKNIWSIEDLRKRILYTLGLVLIYRIGSYVVLPGVDPTQLGALQDQGREGLLGLLNMFSGGAFSNASIFALGIMPYITASIVIQLFVMVVPYFQKMQRDGENGRRKMNQITRWLTVIITACQAWISKEDRLNKWNEEEKESNWQKIVNAVDMMMLGVRRKRGVFHTSPHYGREFNAPEGETKCNQWKLNTA